MRRKKKYSQCFSSFCGIILTYLHAKKRVINHKSMENLEVTEPDTKFYIITFHHSPNVSKIRIFIWNIVVGTTINLTNELDGSKSWNTISMQLQKRKQNESESVSIQWSNFVTLRTKRGELKYCVYYNKLFCSVWPRCLGRAMLFELPTRLLP